eukprot:762852-Hanusia_phi.AAC.3
MSVHGRAVLLARLRVKPTHGPPFLRLLPRLKQASDTCQALLLSQSLSLQLPIFAALYPAWLQQLLVDRLHGRPAPFERLLPSRGYVALGPELVALEQAAAQHPLPRVLRGLWSSAGLPRLLTIVARQPGPEAPSARPDVVASDLGAPAVRARSLDMFPTSSPERIVDVGAAGVGEGDLSPGSSGGGRVLQALGACKHNIGAAPRARPAHAALDLLLPAPIAGLALRLGPGESPRHGRRDDRKEAGRGAEGEGL